jgi:hypothetical protein
MAYRRSLDFLPSVFRTDVNEKFLNSTLDQLISEPELARLGSYIGRRFSPIAGPDDTFINEPTSLRQTYQLEANTTFVDADNKVQFTSSYVDLLRKIDALGGFTNDHSRLFDSTIYNYNAFIDYDKFLNYSSYYWLPNGPDPVTVFATEIPLTQTFEVSPPSTYQVINGEFDFERFDTKGFDVSENSILKVRKDGITFDVTGNTINPTIRLARGGTYTFKLDQIGHGFYIQTKPGTNTSYDWQQNLDVRDVYGVVNNGASVGEVIFNVPNSDAQDYFLQMPLATTASLIAYSHVKNRALRFNEIHNALYEDLITVHRGIDNQRMLEGKTIVFLADASQGKTPQPWAAYTDYAEGDLISYSNEVYRVLTPYTSGRVFNDTKLELFDLGNNWYVPALFDATDTTFDDVGFDRGTEIEYEDRYSKFTVNINAEGYVLLTPTVPISKNTKITILEGTRYGNRDVYRDPTDSMTIVPPVTANLTRLYYADSLDENIGGVIEIVEQDNNLKIDVDNYIIGQEKYTTPNDVRFTNGLKIRFLEDVIPSTYANKTYYVEGVGSGIKLIDVDSLVTTETWLDVVESTFDVNDFDTEAFSASMNAPTTPDYFVINRSSLDKSAWSRQNRWFHKDVIELTAIYNNYPSVIDASQRAKRPIIEFDPNIQLFQMGQIAKKPIDAIDFVNTDALSTVEGKPVTLNDERIITFTGSPEIVAEYQDAREAEGYYLVRRTSPTTNIVTITMKSGGINSYFADGIPLFPGMRVIFANDRDVDVRNKIYVVEWIRPQSSTEDKHWAFTSDGSTTSYDLNFDVDDPSQMLVQVNGLEASRYGYYWSYLADTQRLVFSNIIPPDEATITVSLTFKDQIHLVPAEDADIADGDCVFVKQGGSYQGNMFYYVNNTWTAAQQKTSVNQAPMFDLYDVNKKSFGDTSVYASSTFVGNKLFGYETGNSVTDPILGIKLKYRNINNIGDIVFSDFVSKGNFIYREGQQSITKQTLGSKVKQNKADRSFTFRSQWQKVRDKSRQYQLQTYYATEYQKNLFRLNVVPAGVGEEQLTNLIVYVNNALLYTNRYDIQKEGGIGYLFLDTDLNVGDKLDIAIYSTEVSENAIFSMPSPYSNNPFNEEVNELTLGQFRSHITNVIEDVSILSDEPLTPNNLRDTTDVKSYPGKIIQNSGNPHYANFFLNDKEANFVDSIIYAQREYIRFKNRFLELTKDLAIPGELPRVTVDRVMAELAANKNKNFAFFTSDMVAFSNDYNLRTYTVIDTRLDTYDLSEIMDLTTPSSKAVLVYLNGTQLVVNRDYYFNATRPVVELDLEKVTLNEGDVIEVREYSTTDGSFIPPTPTKLGLYPLSLPAITTDGYDDAMRTMIRGHDGSLTVIFDDSRDAALLELETRIYNNIKVSYNLGRFDIWNYIPGAFRTADYTYEEYTSILSSHFSSWSGANAISVSDFRQFDANDPFTYNYGRFSNRVDGQSMPAANWRGIYRYYYDTDAPHLRPWEMLGFVTQPSWWQVTYGDAPYTAGNKVLWDDLEAGRIAEGDRKGIDARFARPGLSAIIPVDDTGTLLSPLDCIAKDINSLDVSGFFKFGDVGPTELAWRQSSEFPFVMQIAIALMKPAEYFSVNIDTNKQVIDLDDSQIIFSDTGIRNAANQLVQNELDEDGNVYRANSYLTWISEHCRSRGLDVTRCLGNKFRKLQSRLGYKVGGYTDKNYLKIVTEQYTPGSNNPTVVIPDEDYDVVLNKSSPINNLTYSGVIVTKTVDGWSVTGYDDNKPYFMIEESAINNNKTFIKVGKLAITKYHDGTGDFYRVPYGTEFFSLEQVGDFLISYGRYLTRMGFTFTDKLDSDANWYKDWDLAVREFLFYAQQGWGVDVALSLSPVGSKINFRGSFGSVDGLTNRPLNTRALDENFNIIRSTEYTVFRNGRDFSLTVDDERGIYLLDIDVVEYEHVILFQNKTRFNDILYDPVTGDRQYKLKIDGFKTANWDGTYGAPGFIINDDNVVEWQPGVNYSKGDIVTYKGTYFTASEKIPAANEFDVNVWITTEYDKIKKGLLPNLANRSGMFKKFYDSNDVNLEEDGQLLGKELIGFEPRDYMLDLNISDTSQFKFYQGMITQKGTLASLDKLLKAKIDNFGGSANIYEEWAIRVGTYGATGSTRNLQIELDETWANKDPLLIELLNSNDTRPTTHKGLLPKDLYIKDIPFDKNFLKNRTLKTYNTDLYSAGYAQLSDVDFMAPTVNDLNSYVSANKVKHGSLIWIASDRNNQWNVYRVNESDIKIKSANILPNGNATIKCHNNHNLVKNDVIFIKESSELTAAFNGFYVVSQVVDTSTFVAKTGFGAFNIPKLHGVTFKLSPVRFTTSAEISGNEPLMGWKENDTLFVDQVDSNGWAVFKNKNVWKPSVNYSSFTAEANDALGTSVATDSGNSYLIAGRPGYNSGQGGVVLYSITSTGTLNEVAALTTDAEFTQDIGFSVDASNDATFVSGGPTSDDIGFVVTVIKNPESDDFRLQQVLVPDTLDINGEYGYAVDLSDDGNWLAVGQPGLDEGYVYIYQRRFVGVGNTVTVEFEGDGSSNVFELTGDAANPNSADDVTVIQDGVRLTAYTDYNIATSSLVLIATPAFGSKLVVTVERGKPEQVHIADGSSTYYELSGDNATPSSIYALFVEVNGVHQVPFRDFTLEYIAGKYYVNFAVPPTATVEINIEQRTHYEFVTAFTSDSASIGDRFGQSLAWSNNGHQLIIGAPSTATLSDDGSTILENTGMIYVYDRTSESFFADGITTAFTTQETIENRPYVFVDNVLQIENEDYTRIVDTITFVEAPSNGSIVKISTNNFNETTQLTAVDAGEDVETGAMFGYSVDICPTNCSVYVGSPNSDIDKLNEGKVYRFVNQGRLFGNITGEIQDPVISNDSVISINDFIINLTTGDTLDVVVDAINNATIPGVTAYNDNGYLYVESNIIVMGDKLLINAHSGPALDDLGLSLYAHQQTIVSPSDTDYSQFGKAIKVGPNADTLLIGSSNAPSRLVTTIDNNTTYFDGGATQIKDINKQSGAAWVYQYIPVTNETVTNPGYFIPAQPLINTSISKYDMFGNSIAINDVAIYVGSPGDDTSFNNAGTVFSFANPDAEKVWQTIRVEEPKVNIDLLNRIFLYNKKTNQIVTDLDYVDPYKGKVVGIAAEEINYQTPFDPAVYNGTYAGNVWGKEQVGKVWWDISQTRWLNYEHGDVATRSMNWNTAFPGSRILCYEWVESDMLPAQFIDTKDPTAFARSGMYNVVSNIDSNTGVTTNKYYYWVAGKRTIPNSPTRKYSLTAIENFIANPRITGIPYVAFVSSNAIALYNVSEILENKDIVLSIDYDVSYNENSIHSEFQIIAENDASSVASDDLVKKLIDSLAGIDDQGNKVPDIKLTPGEAYGLAFRPRQTMFYDRTYALKSAISYINSVLAKSPIVYTKDLTNLLAYEEIPLEDADRYDDVVNNDVELGYLNIELFAENYRVLVRADATVSDRWTIYQKVNHAWKLIKVQAYDSRRYLQRIDWVKSGVDDPKVTNYTITNSYELVSLTPSIGETVKVKNYNHGLFAVLQFNGTDWDIIKQESATYKIIDELWNATILAQGFDIETFDLQIFDDDPSNEIQLILNACYNDIFTGDEDIEKNHWFILMIKHLLSEQKYVDYAFKTSFIKVEHRNNQAISQIPSLQKDRQESLRKYIEEVKPYHTKIREFVNAHNSIDNLGAAVTDFDLPAYYNETTGKYTSITGKDEIDDIILERDEYQAWVNGHPFNVEEILIATTGIGYTAPPTITVESTNGQGSGVKTTTNIVNGELSRVAIDNQGSGFTATPRVVSDQTNSITIVGDNESTQFQVLPFITDHPESIVVKDISINKKLIYNIDYSINETTIVFNYAPEENHQILIDLDAKLVPVLNNTRIRRIKDVIKLDRLPNNGGFLIQFLDASENAVDIRTQYKSRLLGEHGVLDELFEALSNFAWLKETEAEITWPVPNVSDYRIFPDDSGRIQVQYKKTPGGWTADSLQTYLRALGSVVGVDELDISMTTVIVDGNMSLYQPTVFEWEANTRYDAGDIITYNNVAYTLNDGLPNFTSSESFDTENLRVYDASEFEGHINRTWAYYQPAAGSPGKDIGQLFRGIEFPGVKVQGASFREEPGFDVGNYDMSVFDQYIIGPEGVAVLDPKVLDQTLYSNFLDTSLGTRPEDIITAGAGFVDVYASHAPEETVPGRVYDTLDIKVYSTAIQDITGKDELGLIINMTAHEVAGNTEFSYTPSVTGQDKLVVYSRNYGKLEETAYTVDYVNHTITLVSSFAATDKIYIYAYNGGGNSLIYDYGFAGDGKNKGYDLQTDADLVTQTFVTINGVKQTDFEISNVQPGIAQILFGNTVAIPTVNDYIHVSLFNTDSSVQQYVETTVETVVVTGSTYPTDYIIALTNPIGYSVPMDDKIIVDLNNARLRPPAAKYYIGDALEFEFDVPYVSDVDVNSITESTVSVSLNGTALNYGSDYELTPSDGSTWPQVIMYTIPDVDDLLTVRLSNNADYTVSGENEITLASSLSLVSGDKVKVTAFTNHEKLGIKTTVYKGQLSESVSTAIGYDDIGFDTTNFESTSLTVLTTRDYDLAIPVTNINYLIVTVDSDASQGGQYLIPNSDYILIDNGSKIRLSSTLTLSAESVIVITQFSEHVQHPAIGFRIFKDLNDNFDYIRLASDGVTKLAEPLLLIDDEIFVKDARALPEPNIQQSIPGVIMVGAERITYFGIDYDNNRLYNIRRGTGGTGAIAVIPENTIVQDASAKQRIPDAHGRIWYDQGGGNASNGRGLQNSTTVQAKFLLEKATLLQSQVFDPSYFQKNYAAPGYVEGNLY